MRRSRYKAVEATKSYISVLGDMERESGHNDIYYAERVQLDVWYVRNWSIDLDLMIHIKTIDVVIAKKGSYQQ